MDYQARRLEIERLARLDATDQGHDLQPFVLLNGGLYESQAFCRKCGRNVKVNAAPKVTDRVFGLALHEACEARRV